MRDLYKRYEPEALAEGIVSGHPAMPECSFPPEDVGSIILYPNAIQARQTI